jgi:Transglycosylase SLT domain
MFTGFPAIVAVSQNITVTTPSEAYFVARPLETNFQSSFSSSIPTSLSSQSVLISSSIQSSSQNSSSQVQNSSAIVESSFAKEIISSKVSQPIVIKTPVVVASIIATPLPAKIPAPVIKQEVSKVVEKAPIIVVSSSSSVANSSDIVSSKSSVASIVSSQVSIVNSISSSVPSILSYADKIRARCDKLGCDSVTMIRVMRCESTNNPKAYNAAGPYIGLFQFNPQTFASYANKIGLSNPDIYNPDHQIDVATWMFANGQSRQWGCK